MALRNWSAAGCTLLSFRRVSPLRKGPTTPSFAPDSGTSSPARPDVLAWSSTCLTAADDASGLAATRSRNGVRISGASTWSIVKWGAPATGSRIDEVAGAALGTAIVGEGGGGGGGGER